MTEESLSWKRNYMPWILLGVVYILVDYFIIKQTSVTFNLGLVYGFSLIVVGEMLYMREKDRQPNSWAMLIGALLGAMPLLVAQANFDATVALYATIIGAIVIYWLNHQTGFGKQLAEAKYLVLVPMVIWILWGLVYFQAGINTGTIAYQQIIYRGAITVFAGFSVLRFMGAMKDDTESDKIALMLIGAAVVGMLLVTQGLGVGLQW